MKLVLADGTEFENSYVYLVDFNLFVYIRDEEATLKSVFNSFIESDKVGKISIVESDETVTNYSGFTKLIAIRDEGNGLITVNMRFDNSAIVVETKERGV